MCVFKNGQKNAGAVFPPLAKTCIPISKNACPFHVGHVWLHGFGAVRAASAKISPANVFGKSTAEVPQLSQANSNLKIPEFNAFGPLKLTRKRWDLPKCRVPIPSPSRMVLGHLQNGSLHGVAAYTMVIPWYPTCSSHEAF